MLLFSLFCFLQGRITEVESLFWYKDPAKNYSFFNNDEIKPAEFIGDINITEYISKKCHGQIDLSSCGGDKSCMIDTAATCSITFGDNSKTSNSEATEIRKQIGNFNLNTKNKFDLDMIYR